MLGFLLYHNVTVCSGFSSEVPCSLTQAFFSWEDSFHEATKWHCCPVTVALRESGRMLSTELQARLLLELLQESSRTKRIQLAVTWPLQHQIHLQWFSHLVSPVSLFWTFCLVFRSGSQTASHLTFLQYTSSSGQKSCGILTSAEDRFWHQNFLDLFLTLVGTSAAPAR